jgi:hypothetical protein
MSTKRGNFVRLAEARVTKALKSIKVIGNLSNRTNYDVNKIVNALQAEINLMKSRFKNKGNSESVEFKLSK